MAVAYNSSKIVTDGLVFALDAANIQSYPGSGTTWTEITRTGITATTFNSPTYSSARGGYFSFDGIDDYCTLSSSPNIAGEAATFCVWNYGISAKTSSIIWLGAPLGNRVFQVHLPWSNSIIYFDAGNVNSASESYDRISKAVTDAEYKGWHHWTFIKNSTAGTMSIYRDGNLWHSVSGLYMPVGQAEYRFLGSTADGHRHNGYISNLQFYNRALSQSEVQQNYNAHRSRFITPTIVTDGLVLHLDAGDRQSYPGSGTTWTDLSGNGNNMTIAGSPTYSTLEGFTFDGTVEKYIIRNPITIPTTTLSAEIWVKTTDSGSGIISYNSTGVDNAWLSFNPTNLNLYVGASNTAITGVNIATGTWKQVVRTSNRSTGQEIIYVNGAVASTSTINAGTNLVSGGSLVLGQEQDSVGGGFDVNQAFNGNIASFKLYDKVLSAAEVAQNFNAIRERFGV